MFPECLIFTRCCQMSFHYILASVCVCSAPRVSLIRAARRVHSVETISSVVSNVVVTGHYYTTNGIQTHGVFEIGDRVRRGGDRSVRTAGKFRSNVAATSSVKRNSCHARHPPRSDVGQIGSVCRISHAYSTTVLKYALRSRFSVVQELPTK